MNLLELHVLLEEVRIAPKFSNTEISDWKLNSLIPPLHKNPTYHIYKDFMKNP